MSCAHVWVKNYETAGPYDNTIIGYYALCKECNRVESEQVAMLYNFAAGLGIKPEVVDTFSSYKPLIMEGA